MPYEKFIRRMHRHPRKSKPFITIFGGKNPRITFSAPCTKWFSDKNTKYVEYLWDAEKQMIAFRPAEDGYILQIRQAQSYASGRLFLEYIGNPAKGRYPAIFDEEQNMVVVDLKVVSPEDRLLRAEIENVAHKNTF